jgi:ornithine cyclodeaminase
MEFITLEQIHQILPSLDLVPAIEKGFVAYSEGRVVVPPIGEMILDTGEVHIKYGYIKGDDFYVIKIASGFYQDPNSDQMTGNGMMLLFSQKTGEPICTLLDEGHLTNIRTAVAGSIVAKHLAPARVDKIGIVGAGIQGRLQLSYLKEIVSCRNVLVWGTGPNELDLYKSEMEKEGFSVETTLDVVNIQHQCNLIVTTTPSKVPILTGKDLRKGTHITAMGSDTTEKQEVDPLILKNADLVVADSIEQCMVRGEIFKAMEAGQLEKQDVVELGQIISGAVQGRVSQDQITITDLTGVAVQDINIASAVYRAFIKSK